MDSIVDIIVFSPGADIDYSYAVQDELHNLSKSEGVSLSVKTWKDSEFFGPNNRYLLNECIRKMHKYDGAIIILGPQRGNGSAWKNIILGKKRNINDNVLIEIGAAMARYGRNRVFLLMPMSGSVILPTYFDMNNVNILYYDDDAPSYEAAIQSSAHKIISDLKSLGDTIFFSDLPSFGLAYGYFNNYIRRVAELTSQEKEIEIEGSYTSSQNVRFLMLTMGDRILNRDNVSDLVMKLGLPEGKIQDGSRTIDFRCLPNYRDYENLYIVEIPSNLIPSQHAIQKIEELWAGIQDKEFMAELTQKEMRNYVRYLEVLRASHDATVSVDSDKLGARLLTWVPIADPEELTLTRLQSVIDSIES